MATSSGQKASRSQRIKAPRLTGLHITNVKAIESLRLDFPVPVLPTDPAITVLGSRNGVGKTSVLEAIALLLYCLGVGRHVMDQLLLERERDDVALHLPDIFIRSDKPKASIRGEFAVGQKAAVFEVTLHRTGKIETSDENLLTNSIGRDRKGISAALGRPWPASPLSRILGSTGEPLLMWPCVYFHSYRKVQEGNPDLGSLADDQNRRLYLRPGHAPLSELKLAMLRTIMGQKGVFEGLQSDADDKTFNTLNNLIERYAGGRVESLQPSADNTIDFRVTPTSGGPSYSFDGLSSGQKEAIATCFLIWQATSQRPGIVLIDEPELHLNPEWQQSLLADLHNLCPGNQYIVATHSEFVFNSVEPHARLQLSP